MALTKAKLMELIDNGDIDVGGGGGSGLPPGGVEGQILKKTATAADWGDITIADIKATRGNILHNWDFRNPVNQRAATGDITSGYFYDRWMRYAGTITIAATYLSMPADASIEQRIEGNALSGAEVAVSVMLGGAVISGAGTFPTSAGTASVTLTGFGTATLGYATGYMYVRFTATDSTRQLQAVKLEVGGYSTLISDPPMDHASELLKCQRFFFLLGTKQRAYARFPNAVAVGSTKLGCYVQFPSRMRNIPTFYYTGSLSNYGTVVSNNFTAIEMTDDGVSEGGAFIYFTTSGLTEGHVYSIRAYNSTNASLCFSADL